MLGEGAAVVTAFAGGEHETAGESAIAGLRESLEHSPALAWVKDPEGRYLYVNGRYRHELGTSEERLRGHSDAELPPRETVDGPRLRLAGDGVQEPVQLEYTVPAFEGRPPLVALRFPLHDDSGRSVGMCGVAAPLGEAQLARDEAVRLMGLDRRVPAYEPPPAYPPQPEHQPPQPEYQPPQPEHEPEPVAQPAPASQAAALQPLPEPEWEENQRLHSDLELARTWAEHARQLQLDLEQAHSRARQLEAELEQTREQLAAARQRGEELGRVLGAARTMLGSCDAAVWE